MVDTKVCHLAAKVTESGIVWMDYTEDQCL